MLHQYQHRSLGLLLDSSQALDQWELMSPNGCALSSRRVWWLQAAERQLSLNVMFRSIWYVS